MLSQLLMLVVGILGIVFICSLVWIAILVASAQTEIPIHKHNDDLGGDYDDYERQLVKPR